MPENTRFLLGYGERLTERVAAPGGGNPTVPAYTFEEAIARLNPMLSVTSENLIALPNQACPNDEAVSVLTLHPQWIAKSSSPATT